MTAGRAGMKPSRNGGAARGGRGADVAGRGSSSRLPVVAALGALLAVAALAVVAARESLATPGTAEVAPVREAGPEAVPPARPAAAPPVRPEAVPEPGTGPAGIWIGPSELAALPVSGPAWSNLVARADDGCGTPDLSDQDQDDNVCVLAGALVYARTGRPAFRAGVVSALAEITHAGPYVGRSLALGRELPAYVIAADLVALGTDEPSLERAFRARLRELLTTPTAPGPANLVACHETRPNNWGTHCGAARAAVAAYLGDATELERVARVFRGWLGDRSSHAGFDYGDRSWQCDPERPVGINPEGCRRDGHPLGGALPDDLRRAGGLSWPPPRENYVWEALQGALVQAVILHRAGYDAFEWEDRALHRAVRWLHEQAGFPAEGDDAWQPHLVNHFYGSSFPAPVPARPGKNMGWTDWTHPPGR